MTTTPCMPDLAPMDDQEIDAYLRPILEAQHTAEKTALKAAAQAEAATDTASREFYQGQARTHASLARGYLAQTEPYMAEWQRRGCPERRTMTRREFLATAPRDLVVFPEGRAPYVLVDKPKAMSRKAYDAHIDRAGKILLVARRLSDGLRIERLTADAQSARAFWISNEQYNHRWPDREHEHYVSAHWATEEKQ